MGTQIQLVVHARLAYGQSVEMNPWLTVLTHGCGWRIGGGGMSGGIILNGPPPLNAIPNAWSLIASRRSSRSLTASGCARYHCQ